MAAMSGGRRGSAGDHEDHKIKMFYIAMQESQKYPFNLDPRHTFEKIKFVSDFRQHFDQTKDDILLVLGQNVKSFRRKLIERKIHVEFYDAGLRDSSSNLISTPPQRQPPVAAPRSSDTPGIEWVEGFASSWDSKDDIDVYSVSNPKYLDDMFGIDRPLDRATNPRLRNGNAAAGNEPRFQPRADPVCRFIFLATSAPNARRLKITEELLLKILTYHQVSPYFLNLISSFGHEPLSGAGDHFFGGFRSRKFFSEPLFNLSALGRSGCHYQLAFEFRTVFRPPSQDAEYEDRQLGERDIINEFVNDDPRKIRRGTTNNNRGTAWRLLPSWLRPRGDDDAGDEAATEFSAHISDNPDLWPLGQCAIYHQFDVENGKSLWMMTAAEGEGNRRLSEPEDGQGYPFRDVRDARFSTNVLSSSPIDERFRASLSVLLWLADWSLSEYGHYITMLDDELQRMTRPYIEDMGDGGPVREIGLKKLNRYMEELDRIIVALQGNLRVCKAALKFYRDELLQDRKLRARNLPWMTDKASRARIQEDLGDFHDKIRWVCTSTQEMLRRTIFVKQAGVRREDTLKLLLSNRDHTLNSELARMTYLSITSVRVFSSITLALLPVSVVSTIFSANIVDFQSGIGGFAGNWSGPAALWWAIMSFLMTLAVGWVSNRWLRHAIDAQPGKTRLPTTAVNSYQESWTTSVRRIINDARIYARPYVYAVSVAYIRAVGVVKKAGTAVARPRRRRVESADPPLQSPPAYARDVHHTTPEAWPMERLPSSSSLVSVRSASSDPVPDGGGAGSGGDGGGTGMAARASVTEEGGLPQKQLPAQPAGGFEAVDSLEGEQLHNKGFDQASAAEQGLVRVTEKVVDGTEGEET